MGYFQNNFFGEAPGICSGWLSMAGCLMSVQYRYNPLFLLSLSMTIGCLCLLSFQPAIANSSRQTATASAKKKSQHALPKKHRKKTTVIHQAWTKRDPSVQEFTAPSSKQQAAFPDKGIPDVDRHGNLIASAGASSVFMKPTDKQLSPAANDQADRAEKLSPASSYRDSGGVYALGPASFELNYERQNDRSLATTRDLLAGKRAFGIDQNRFIESPLDRDSWHVGMNYAVGQGHFNAAVDYTRMKNDRNAAGSGNDPADMRSVTFGYTHNVSENTAFYGSVTHTEYDMSGISNNTGTASVEDGNINQVNVGIQHRF